MVVEINKIVFTTKEAYEQRVAEGTLEEGVVYAIDAAQAADKKTVQNTVDNNFNEFGLSLGIDKEAAKLYNTPISLTAMLKDIIIEKFNSTIEEGLSLTLAGNGTRNPFIGQSEKGLFIKVEQNNVNLGFILYTIPDSERDTVAQLSIPESVNLEEEFTLTISNIFNTKHFTIKMLPSFEPIAVKKIKELHSEINFSSTPTLNNPTYYSGGEKVINIGSRNIVFFKDINNFSADNLIGNGIKFCILPKNQNLPDSEFKELFYMNNATAEENCMLLFDKDFTGYLDLGTNTWKEFPTSVSEEVTALKNYFDSVTNQ